MSVESSAARVSRSGWGEGDAPWWSRADECGAASQIRGALKLSIYKKNVTKCSAVRTYK